MIQIVELMKFFSIIQRNFQLLLQMKTNDSKLVKDSIQNLHHTKEAR